MAASSVKNVKRKIPLVLVILGSTGTGKSKLGVELARLFKGEVISADSMQIYKSLDIITNKVTEEEQKLCRHHMIDFVDPLSRYTVADFQSKALPIIDHLLHEEKLPVIVGGTNYYIESLLWKVLVRLKNSTGKLLYDEDKDMEMDTATRTADDIKQVTLDFLDRQKQDVAKAYSIMQDKLDDVPSEVLHKKLKEVDPAMADRLHPHNRRKIIRSLQVYQQQGRLHSEIIADQSALSGGSSLGGPLRYPHTCILWLQCDQTVLDKRLCDRVDEMLQRGLLQELSDFHSAYNEQRLAAHRQADYTKGIFQSIGFKEFHDYLMLSEEERLSEKGKHLLSQGTEQLKQATKRYSRKQVKWINNRFLRRPDRQVPLVFGLDVMDLTKWEDNVLQRAINIVQAFYENKEEMLTPLPLAPPVDNEETTYHCDICDKMIVGKIHWENHIKSNKHHKRKRSIMQDSEQAKKKGTNCS